MLGAAKARVPPPDNWATRVPLLYATEVMLTPPRSRLSFLPKPNKVPVKPDGSSSCSVAFGPLKVRSWLVEPVRCRVAPASIWNEPEP